MAALDAIGVAAYSWPFFVDALVNVVAEIEHEFWIFVGEMAVSGEIAVLVIGAGHEAEAGVVQARIWALAK